MKITIAYGPGEEKQADSVLDTIRHQLGKVRVKYSDRHKPYLHIYVAKEPPSESSQKTDS